MKSVFAAYDWRGNLETEQYRFCPLCGAALLTRKIEQKNRLACSRCSFIHFKNPAPAVSVLIVEGDRVLLGKRANQPGRGQWALPSGYIDYDEDFIAAAMREAKEETGLKVEIESVLHVESSFLSPHYHFLGVYLLAHATGGTLAPGDDLDEVDWLPATGPLPEMAFQPDRDLIEMYATGHTVGLLVE